MCDNFDFSFVQMNSLKLSASATDEEMLKRTTNAGGPPEDQETVGSS